MATLGITQPGEGDVHTKPAFLRRVRVRGYKSLALCDVPLHPLTVLVGRNAAGKSNFLDALAFLKDIMDTSATKAVERRGGWSALFDRASKKKRIVLDIEAAFRCGRPYQLLRRNRSRVAAFPSDNDPPDLEGVEFLAKYRLELSSKRKSAPIASEWLEIDSFTGNHHAGFEVKQGIISGWRSDSSEGTKSFLPHSRELLSFARPDQPLLSVLGWQPFIDLGDGLRTMGFYNFYPEQMRQLQTPLPGVMLQKDGRNVASVLKGLREIDADLVKRLQDYLSAITNEVQGFKVAEYGEYETIKFRLRGPSSKSPLAFDAASMSDGTLRALAALLAAFQIHLPSGPTVVGIEEPETALHPAATGALVDALHEASYRVQVLLTTHSPDILGDPDLGIAQVLVVRNRGGHTHITPVDVASREIIQKELYTLADLQRMDQLELNEADLKRQIAGSAADGKD